jgi:uncharacterized protein YndB with AHSA1/START domain
MTDLKVNVEKNINSPIEEAFDAWLNPTIMSKFMMGMPGMAESEVENEAREGGNFTVVMHYRGEKFPHTGKYLEISRPDKLVFTWTSRHSVVDKSTVTLHFSKINDNRTKISLTHVKFINEEERSGHEKGWSHILDNLNRIMS